MEWDSTIVGEDDSLIQQTPRPPKPCNRISPAKGIKVSKGPVPVKLNCSSPEDMSNKENISTNNCEGSKLSVESVQMKKKKKGGGYNLRKSLAWNRAFFTDEGVLDPEELSVISGTLGNSSREGLSTINEKAINSLSDDYQFNVDSGNVQALEKNLFKEFHASPSKKDRASVCLPPKHNSPARFAQASTSKASFKVLPTHGARKTVSRGGSSAQSLPPSSLKRPANIIAQKAVSKESKLPKLPISKPGHPSLPATNKSAIHGATSSQQNQILRPTLNIQRNMELKSYPKSVKYPRIKAKAGSESLPAKSSASHAKRNKVNPPVNLHASTQLCPVQVNKVDDSGPKVTPGDVHTSITVDSSEDQDVITQLSASLPLNDVIRGGTLQCAQIQLTKPSGLRMPSPSIGYFGQSKASVSHCFSRKVVETNPRLGKLTKCRPPQLPAKIPVVVNANKLGANPMVLSSRYDLNAVSNEAMIRDIGEDARKEWEKIPQESGHCELEVDKQMMMSVTVTNENFQNHVKNDISVILEEDKGAEINDDSLLLETESCRDLTGDGNANKCVLDHRTGRESSGSNLEHSQLLSQENCEQCSTGVTGTRITIKDPAGKEKSGNSAVIDQDDRMASQTGDVYDYGVPKCAMLRSNSVSCVQDLHQPSRLHPHKLETLNDEEFLVPYVDNPSILKGGSSKKLVGDSQNSASAEIGNKSSETLGVTNFKLKNSGFSSQNIHPSQSEDSLMSNERIDNLHIEETVLQIPDMILSDGRCENSLKQSLEVGELEDPSAKFLELQTDGLEIEQISKITNGLPTADCVSLGNDIGSEEYLKEVTETFPFVISDKRGKSERDNSCAEVAEAFGGIEGEVFDANHMTGDDIVRNPMLDSVEVTSPVANHNHVLLTNSISDVVLSSEGTSLDLHSYSSEASEFFVAGAHGSFDGNKVKNREVNDKNLATVGPLRQILDTSALSESYIRGEEQKCDLQNIAETDPRTHCYSQIELEPFSTLPEVAILVQTSEARREAAKVINNISQAGDDPENLADDNVPVECCIGHTLVVCNQYTSGANCTEESEQPEFPNSCILLKQVSGYNNELHLRNYLYEETIESAKPEESSLLESGVDAFPGESEPCVSELKSSRAVTDALLSPLPEQVNGNDGGKFHDSSGIEETRSSCMEIEPSYEKYKLFTGSQIRNDVELGGLLVEGDLMLPISINQSVGVVNSALTETKPGVCQDIYSIHKDKKSNLDTSLCNKNDENATVPVGLSFSDGKKPVSNSNKTNPVILPPRNAVPFSDEWLAVIEAAGEEILTMKSGAVQNSPPDKSLPEPSPWSPVKRKNNAVGPYDCTKFTNNLSSDPQ